MFTMSVCPITTLFTYLLPPQEVLRSVVFNSLFIRLRICVFVNTLGQVSDNQLQWSTYKKWHTDNITSPREPICLGLIILETAGDRDSVTMDHL